MDADDGSNAPFMSESAPGDPSGAEPLFGTHIREAIDVLRGKSEPEPCAHCWHQWGSSGGGISATETWMCGTHRCCFCGETKRYDIRTSIEPPRKHGPYHYEILTHVG
jgi:hypothetical protein